MPDAASFTLFAVASLALLVVPGPAVLYIVARAIDHGRRAGMVSVLGLAAGSVVMVAAAAFGVAALLAASPRAFDALRYLGAGYLAWLGLRTATSRDPVVTGEPEAASLRRVFRDGVVVSLLNPKSVLFFFAFLPQFVNPAGSVRLQIIVLGLVFIGMAVVTDGTYALVAGSLAGKLRSDNRFLRIRRVLVPAVYFALAFLAVRTGQTK